MESAQRRINNSAHNLKGPCQVWVLPSHYVCFHSKVTVLNHSSTGILLKINSDIAFFPKVLVRLLNSHFQLEKNFFAGTFLSAGGKNLLEHFLSRGKNLLEHSCYHFKECSLYANIKVGTYQLTVTDFYSVTLHIIKTGLFKGSIVACGLFWV